MPRPTAGSSTTTKRQTWQLVMLTVAVLLAHWAVLRAAPLALTAQDNRDSSNTWAFATRTIAAPLPAPSPVPVAVNPTRTAPARTPVGKKPAPSPNLFPPSGFEQNQALAPVDIESVATELVAISAEDTPSIEAPTTLAAASPPTKPLPAKAVRNYVFPPPARLKYTITGEVKGFPYHVNGELTWMQDGATYDARMEISHFLLGSRVQTSTGQLTAQGLEPTRFGDKVKSEVAAHFERDKGQISFSANTPSAPLLAGAQDQLSIFMQVASMLGVTPMVTPRAARWHSRRWDRARQTPGCSPWAPWRR